MTKKREHRDKSARLRRANATLRAVGKVYADADRALAPVAAKASCRDGCSGCCYQLVLASTAEAEYIVRREWRAVAAALPALRGPSGALKVQAPARSSGEAR